MDQQLLREREAKCVQENLPGCSAGCPVHVDARGIAAAVRKGDYTAGFALLYRMVPFPGIISSICEAPCRQSCKRSEIDAGIKIRNLEKICVEKNTKPLPKITIPKPKDQKVAVIGAGLSSLTVAFELARKGYQVVVYEAGDKMGGSVWNFSRDILPEEVILADFAVFDKLPLEFRYNTPVTDLKELTAEYDALYLGIGRLFPGNIASFDLGLSADGSLVLDPLTLAAIQPKIFAGGSLRRSGEECSPIFSVSDGKIAAISIDRLFQNASLTANRENEGPFTSLLYTNTEGVVPQAVTPAADKVKGYTEKEALREANRCLSCSCLECVKVCEYLAHYRAYPKRYVREVYNNLSIVMGIHHANKMINTCNLCGLCEKVCPGKLNMGEIIQETRQAMVKKGKMPPSAHDFALRDMKYSNSEHFLLNKHQPGFTASKYVFYPGCQLAASAPRQVKAVYQFLSEKVEGGVGVMLGCCGAPASWAGEEDLFQEKTAAIKTAWEDMGKPKIITACPTCYSLFKKDMPAEILWEFVDKNDLAVFGKKSESIPLKLALHDSCAARDDLAVQNSARSLAAKFGIEIEELPRNREYATCCGYGGLMLYANQEVTQKVINRRVSESESDYLTYCSMCRDNFAGQGKKTYHLLDFMFNSGEEELGAPGPDYSERQANRSYLKKMLLKEIWGETVPEEDAGLKIIIPEKVKAVMAERMILTAEVAQVITCAEDTNTKLQLPENGHYLAYRQIEAVTYWVEYSAGKDEFIVHNAYCHRVRILE